MTATNHAVTGALIAVTVKQPVLAITLAFMSHFILDMLPHFGIKEEIEQLKKSWLIRIVFLVELFTVTTAFLYLPGHLNHLTGGVVVFLCMFAAVGPDLMWTYRYAKKFTLGHHYKCKSTLMEFHEKIQTYEKPAGMLIEAIWLAVFLPKIVHLLRV